MYTVIATSTFVSKAKSILTEFELEEFCVWIAMNPEAGDVIPCSGGCRKVRVAAKGKGKRSGVRVIYFNRLQSGVVVLLTVYSKAVVENIPGPILQEIKLEVEKGLNHA